MWPWHVKTPIKNLLRLMLMLRNALKTVRCRCGSWKLIIKLNFCSDIECKKGFEVGFWIVQARFWGKSLVRVLWSWKTVESFVLQIIWNDLSIFSNSLNSKSSLSQARRTQPKWKWKIVKPKERNGAKSGPDLIMFSLNWQDAYIVLFSITERWIILGGYHV